MLLYLSDDMLAFIVIIITVDYVTPNVVDKLYNAANTSHSLYRGTHVCVCVLLYKVYLQA